MILDNTNTQASAVYSFYIVSILFALCVLFGCGRSRNEEQGNPETNYLPKTAQVLFLSNRDTGSARNEIYAMDANGGNVTRITNTVHQHYIFGIDLSQQYIIATRGTDTKKRLWLIDLATDTDIPLTDENDNAEGRSFSPDGEWIVFWMIISGETYSDIFKIKTDGSNLTNLTNTPNNHEFDPCWSNSGTEISFSYYDNFRDRIVLKVMDTNGGNVREIYDNTSSVATNTFPAGVYDSSWSPDDQWLLVETPVQFTNPGENGWAGIWRIHKARSDGAIVYDITGSGPYASSALYLPSFSPNGEWIIVTARYGPTDPAGVLLDIFKMDEDGNSIINITNSMSWDQFAIWIN